MAIIEEKYLNMKEKSNSTQIIFNKNEKIHKLTFSQISYLMIILSFGSAISIVILTIEMTYRLFLNRNLR